MSATVLGSGRADGAGAAVNAPAKIETPLAKLREPFSGSQVSKLPKETRAQIDARKGQNGRNVMVFNCAVCGGHHHKDAVHLDYVGHAAITDRLLDVDLEWSWEPMALTPEGLPMLDRNGGLWIKLTVCGVSRPGYGSADGKSGGDAVKEIIGDALRNAAMRFGAALDLWHKGDLHAGDDAETNGSGGDTTGDRQISSTGPAPNDQGGMPDAEYTKLVTLFKATSARAGGYLKRFGVQSLRYLNQQQYGELVAELNDILADMAKKETNAMAGGFGEILDDEIPY